MYPWREGGREGEREGGRERGREGEREGERDAGRQGGKEERIVSRNLLAVMYFFCSLQFFPQIDTFITGNCWILSNTSTLRVRVTARYEGGVASYQCVNNSYTLIGPSQRECLNNGNWNGTVPSCISKPVCIIMYIVLIPCVKPKLLDADPGVINVRTEHNNT